MRSQAPQATCAKHARAQPWASPDRLHLSIPQPYRLGSSVWGAECRHASTHYSSSPPLAPGMGPRSALWSSCAGMTFMGTQNRLLHMPPQLNLLTVLLGQELHSLTSPQVMSPRPPISRASRPLLSPSHHGAIGSPAQPGALGCSSLCMGAPSFSSCRDASALTSVITPQKHLPLSSQERLARPPCALTRGPGVSPLARPLQLCLYTHLSTWRPHTSTVTRSLPTPFPGPAILPLTQQVLNKCLWSEHVEAPRLQGFKPKPSEWRVHGHGARVSAQQVVPERPALGYGANSPAGDLVSALGSAPSLAT